MNLPDDVTPAMIDKAAGADVCEIYGAQSDFHGGSFMGCDDTMGPCEFDGNKSACRASRAKDANYDRWKDSRC